MNAVLPVLLLAATLSAGPVEQWLHYGGDLHGTRHAPETAISPDNVSRLQQAWVFRTGDATTDDERFRGRASSFKATPILVDGQLVFSTGFNRVVALDARTGIPLWRFDPELDSSIPGSGFSRDNPRNRG